MNYKGIIRGKTIELEEPLPYEDGQPVSISVEPLVGRYPKGSKEAILEAVRKPPHLTKEDMDAFEQAIKDGELPVNDKGIFDEEEDLR